MGCSQDKEDCLTIQIKSEKLIENFKRKHLSENKANEESTEICLQDSVLYFENEKIPLSLPDCGLRLLLSDPYSKEFILYLNDGSKWSFSTDNLNTFLKWKQALSVSMRPSPNKSSKYCQQCLRSFSVFRRPYNCKCCGKRCCVNCCRFIVTLNFLCYITDERICEDCKHTVIRIKSEETESQLRPGAQSKSFLRKSSAYENQSIHDSIKRENSKSIFIKTGCPSALNTLS